MSAVRVSELGKTNTVFSQGIENAKEGKKEVTDAQYHWIGAVGFIIVSCLALQNGLYGWGQGAMLLGMVVLAVMYFAGDWALSSITGMFAPKWASWFLAFITVVGLFLLSLTAGVSFMLSQQQAKDVENSRIGELEARISDNRDEWNRTHKIVTENRIATLEEQLKAERDGLGANRSESNAIYVYLSKFSGYSYEVTSIVIRSVWILIFIFTAMSLSALKGLLWCPSREKALCRSLEKKFREENRQVKQEMELKLERQRITQEIQNCISESCNLPQKKPATLGERDIMGKHRPSIESQSIVCSTLVDNDIRREESKLGKISCQRFRSVNSTPRTRRPSYAVVKSKIIEGEIKPTQKSLIDLGMGAGTASEYRQRMIDEGIIKVVNHRGDCRLVVHQ